MGMLSGSDIDRITQEIVKEALNSTIDTPEFKPLNELLGSKLTIFTEPGEYIPRGDIIYLTGIAAGEDGGKGQSGTNIRGTGGTAGKSGENVLNEKLFVKKDVPIQIVAGFGNIILTQDGNTLYVLLKGGNTLQRVNDGTKGSSPANYGYGGDGGWGIPQILKTLLDTLSLALNGVICKGGNGGNGGGFRGNGQTGTDAQGFGTGGGGGGGCGLASISESFTGGAGGKGAPGIVIIEE